ncbi:predicted protein [Nematostella vectensis]|uniref:Jumonji-like protein n=1 Tax=Nematostella vectensis TaxID=45351 RepID=A7RHU2_NEMVE|nr:lysine-specific demethylase 8 [Nematostella vectensis]AFP87443.1 jumonji-like protein [Nematostella vectensis]EDO49037.1 predicted protein [Nematostella vectensis]|eukprot:XP_001641100.1 predicted protein [Nematostella vectensis]
MAGAADPPSLEKQVGLRPLPVKVLESISPDIFNHFFRSRAPVVFKGFVKAWKPCQMWTPLYLKTRLGETCQTLSVMVSHDNERFVDNNDFTSRKMLTAEEMINAVFESNLNNRPENQRLYFRSSSMPTALHNDICIDSQMRELFDKVSPIVATESGDDENNFEQFVSAIFRQHTTQLWVGTAGNITPLHYDRNHGLLMQIRGQKKIILFSTEDTNFLYPFPGYSEKSHISKVNLRDVNVNVFPKFVETQPYCCLINKGDMLYIPPFWWHDVTSLDNCVSVTLSWDISGLHEIPLQMLR